MAGHYCHLGIDAVTVNL